MSKPAAPRPAAAPERQRAAAATPAAPAAAIAPVRLGNRAWQALMAPADGRGEPPEAEALRASMGARFGLSFAGVRLRTDAQAAQLAAAGGALAYASADEIGFAPGAYAPRTAAGRLRIAHEFAHIAQYRGGNLGAALPLPSAGLAEWQARRAALAVASGVAPKVLPFAGGGPLYDKGEQADAAPVLASTNDQEVLAVLLKMLDTHAEGAQRRAAIGMLAALGIKPGPAQKAASDRLFGLLAGIPHKNFSDHMDAIAALREWTGREMRAYDLLLYGRFWFADRSKNEIGSGLALDVFRRYLHQAGGKSAITFFQLRINGADRFRASLAARVVADLLEGSAEPAEAPYRANYAALRRMARANGWDSYGPLAVASATPRIFAALDAIRSEARTLAALLLHGPQNDPSWEAERKRLLRYAEGLSRTGAQSIVDIQGNRQLLYTAENRGETEHALLEQPAEIQATATQEMALALAIAAAAGAHLAQRLDDLHAIAAALDQFLGPQGAQASDERAAVFELRQDYLTAWMSVGGTSFGREAGGLAAGYQARLDEVERRFEHFDEVVARRKFRSTRERFGKYSEMWSQGNQRYQGNDRLDERFFFTMRTVLQQERDSLQRRLALGAASRMGNVTVRLPASDDYIPTDLRLVAALERDTSIFGMQAALFMVYATSLSLHNLLLKSEVGTQSFRAGQAAPLEGMRSDMARMWQQGDFENFMKRADGYGQTLGQVADAIQARAKIDFLLNLGITLVAALITEGAALGLRLAALSETLALARTARALASAGALLEVGVFTGSELAMQKAVFGKDIGAGDALKSFAGNLAFLGILKAIGRAAGPLAQGGNLRKLLIGHAIGLGGMAGVSATMQRIESGQWPPDMAAFLTQTALTYVLVAGVHHVFQEKVAKPRLNEAATARWDKLQADNQALAELLQKHVNEGTLDQAGFEAMRAERLRIIAEVRALGQVREGGGLLSGAELAEVNRLCDHLASQTAGAVFVPPAPGEHVVRALPAPESVPELAPAGAPQTYTYDPARPHPALDAMLARYKAKGFLVQGGGGLLRVAEPNGRTRFLLHPGPLPQTRLLLPAGSGAPTPVAEPLARATGRSGPALEAARAGLRQINREAEAKLPAEYPDHTALAAFAMLAEQAPVIGHGWSIDAVRGVADALSLERGIARSAVRRLFTAIDPARLPELFEAFHEICNSPKVAPGSRHLIADDLLPKNSVVLIEAWRRMKAKGLELPADMDRRAVRGVARQVQAMPGGWLQWLGKMPREARAEALASVSGLHDPRGSVPATVSELLAELSADLPGHAGLNPLAGATGAGFVELLERQPGAGRFDEPALRAAFIAKVDRMRLDAAMLEQGRAPERGMWENVVGRANEVQHIALTLLRGSTILAADAPAARNRPLPSIDLSAFPLPGGGAVLNARPEINVHIDLLHKEGNGALVLEEMTSATLNLPKECAALDPLNPAYGGNVDAAALELKVKGDDRSARKWLQILKIRQLRRMGELLGGAGPGAVPVVTRVQAGDFTVEAARALENLGFQMVLPDGRIETAAQVAARKRGKKARP